jgi:hypothetical protein
MHTSFLSSVEIQSGIPTPSLVRTSPMPFTDDFRLVRLQAFPSQRTRKRLPMPPQKTRATLTLYAHDYPVPVRATAPAAPARCSFTRSRRWA